MIKNTYLYRFFTVFIFLLHTIPSLLGQDPPDITPTDFPGGTPFALGTVIIPPFNAADPGSTQLGNGQLVELKVMTSLTGQPSYQWKKEGTNIPNATSDSYMIPEVGDEYTVMRIGGKMGIDATKPPTWRAESRKKFQRVDPMGKGDEAIAKLLEMVRQPG